MIIHSRDLQIHISEKKSISFREKYSNLALLIVLSILYILYNEKIY